MVFALNAKPAKATTASAAMKTYDWCTNLKGVGRGYMMESTSRPLTLSKPVRTTTACTRAPGGTCAKGRTHGRKQWGGGKALLLLLLL